MDILNECYKIGRQPKTVHFVYSDGDTFSITGTVEEEAAKLGYRVGIMCCEAPRALSKTAHYIAKWWNMESADYPKMEGFVLCDDPRDGTMAAIVEFI